MITIHGKFGIYATILADSISMAGVRMLTFEIAYPRIILAELNTHRAESKNSASSRAIPFTKMVTQLNGRPVRFGAANPGMQDTGKEFDARIHVDGFDGDFGDFTPDEVWDMAKIDATSYSSYFFKAGYHKQIYNRLTEPFQMMKTVISGTEWSNFFWLRDDGMADPTLAELARCMREAKDASTPELLEAGEWHLPYVLTTREDNQYMRQEFWIDNYDGVCLTLEEAIKVSCARCAAVSYRNEGYGLEKSLELYERLVGSDKKHASALEHCATPMREYGYYDGVFGKYQSNHAFIPFTWEEGISHVDRKGKLWSGNLKGFIQYRKLVPGENYEE